MGAIDFIGMIVSKTGNWGAIAFGLLGMIVTGYFGYKLKKPMMIQAAENIRFTTTLDGMKSLNEGQAARILFLENQLRIKDEYEVLLIKRHHDCEDRCLRLMEKGFSA